MAFLLYSVVPRSDACRHYSQAGEFSLAGNRNGLILKACQKYLADSPTGWTVSEKDLLKAGGYDQRSNALVSDISPDRKSEVNLFEIKAISGYTYDEWTPLMLTMEVLVNE